MIVEPSEHEVTKSLLQMVHASLTSTKQDIPFHSPRDCPMDDLMIFEAIVNDELDVIRKLLKEHPELVNHVGGAGDTPLHEAALHRKVAAATLLLESGADVNAKGHNGQTPLHYAARGESPSMVELLLAHGADPTVTDSYGVDPVTEAAFDSPSGTNTGLIIDSMLRHGGVYGLLAAIRLNDIESVRAQLQAKPTALQELPKLHQVFAIDMALEDPELLTLLLDHGGDPNVKDKKHPVYPPLARTSRVEVAKILLDYGADPNALNYEGKTPLQLAKKYKEKEMQKLLLQYGATEHPPAKAKRSRSSPKSSAKKKAVKKNAVKKKPRQ